MSLSFVEIKIRWAEIVQSSCCIKLSASLYRLALVMFIFCPDLLCQKGLCQFIINLFFSSGFEYFDHQPDSKDQSYGITHSS